MLLASAPLWILAHLTCKTSSVHRLTATMKVEGSQLQYENFISDVCKLLTAMQCCSLEKVFFHCFKIMLDWPLAIFSTHNGAVFWAERLTAVWVTYESLIWQVTHVECSLSRVVKGIKFHQANLGRFSICDLERLKEDDKWLSDSHVTLGLQWVLLVLFFPHLKEAAIVFKMVFATTFGGQWRSSCWTHRFGAFCQTVQKNMGTGSKRSSIFWITTSSLCPCLSCKRVCKFGK